MSIIDKFIHKKDGKYVFVSNIGNMPVLPDDNIKTKTNTIKNFYRKDIIIKTETKTLINITQTITKNINYYNGKDIIEKDFCPKSIYHCFVLGEGSIISQPMLYGLYFEDKCLNLNRNIELPLTLRNTKTHNHIRIDKQIENFKRLSKMYGINTTETQKTFNKVIYEDNDIIINVTGTIDIISDVMINNDVKKAIIDIKLTRDINNTFGDFSWGRPENIDKLQPHTYMLISNIHTFVYWVFDYKPYYENKFFVMDYEEEEIQITMERHKRAAITLYTLNPQQTNPSYNNCMYCKLNIKNGGTCYEANNFMPIK